MTESSSTIPATTPAPGTFRLDPDRTTIRVDGKGMFGLTPCTAPCGLSQAR